MNILVDTHVFDDKPQGTRTYLKGLYSELILLAPEWNFYLIANNIENLKKEFGIHKNVIYVELQSQNKFYRLLIELPLIIKKHDINYAHYQYISPPIKNCKQIITNHDILFEQKEFKAFFPLKYRLINSYLFKTSAKRADILLTVSEYSKRKISELYKIDKDHIKLTPNAVSLTNSNLIDNKAIQKLGKYILYVSRVEPRKNHLNLLKAFTELNLVSKGFKLIFIGKMEVIFNDLKFFLDNLSETDKKAIIWLENIADEDLKLYYQNCELFVFPSFAEGFGIPPLEAMVFKKKVLCSKNTAMADFGLPDEVTFNPHDINEIKTKIEEQLHKDFELDNIYNTILSKFNWKVIAENYKEIISNHFEKL
ncbi:glycosyltransferase family 4 protein [Winogradskyella litoriviva]|uniref:Glycosyltransferase family 4 protein n=1 Tax=Winogradskyella litoriviva TaxID=1220182 RepID=A0ABX2E108_9FLAO|nr:glycosyltransferase family 1 protein [Winogradskyella litoriviva]NRD22156.1 glycosyltransferase family 4 protein [Winogradskyella litoriviva]